MDIRRGIIRAFDSNTYLADVQIVGSMATMLIGVPVAKQIGADLLTSGSKCGVLFFDETNPADGCVVFIYGEAHPGHITIPQGKEFRPGGDANTAFGEEAAGNAYLKDAIAGTKTLAQLASGQLFGNAQADAYFSTSAAGAGDPIPDVEFSYTPTVDTRVLVIGYAGVGSVSDYARLTVVAAAGSPTVVWNNLAFIWAPHNNSWKLSQAVTQAIYDLAANTSYTFKLYLGQSGAGGSTSYCRYASMLGFVVKE